MVKNLPSMQETQEMWVRSAGQEDPCRGKWQPTPVFLPGKPHGQRRLVGYSSWGCKGLDTTEHTTQKQTTRGTLLKERAHGVNRTEKNRERGIG